MRIYKLDFPLYRQTNTMDFHSLFYILADCGGNDPDANEEMEKTYTDLVAEELRLRTNVIEDSRQHAEASMIEMKKTSSQYQKESEKCNIGIETCEEAREKAEEALRYELKQSAIWEERARNHGWTE